MPTDLRPRRLVRRNSHPRSRSTGRGRTKPSIRELMTALIQVLNLVLAASLAHNVRATGPAPFAVPMAQQLLTTA